MSRDEYRQIDEVYSTGSFLIMRDVLRAMLQQEPRIVDRSSSRGSIVILTLLASEGAFAGVGNYIVANTQSRILYGLLLSHSCPIPSP